MITLWRQYHQHFDRDGDDETLLKMGSVWDGMPIIGNVEEGAIIANKAR